MVVNNNFKYLDLDSNCGICDHPWFWHDYPYDVSKRHLVGGWEYAPIYCHCYQTYPKNNIEYLEYMEIINGMKRCGGEYTQLMLNLEVEDTISK